MKIPVTLRIDDPSPVISVYYCHHKNGFTEDGREVIRYYPNSFLNDFCDVIEKWGIKGKFSIVPMPGNCGDIINGIDGVDNKDRLEWIDTVKKRVVPLFDISPEMLTHNKVVDIETGKVLDIRENDWSQTQNRNTLAPYISKALSILKQAGFDCGGVTSPWNFAIECENEYVAAISQAMWDVYGKKESWYFLRGMYDTPNAKPWIEYESDGRTVIAVPTTAHDRIWQTIDSTETSNEYISHVADQLITADGKGGDVVKTVETGGYPVIITHWQSLASNGLFTGLRVLDEVARRIDAVYGDRVEWMNIKQITDLVLADKSSFRKNTCN